MKKITKSTQSVIDADGQTETNSRTDVEWDMGLREAFKPLRLRMQKASRKGRAREQSAVEKNAVAATRLHEALYVLQHIANPEQFDARPEGVDWAKLDAREAIAGVGGAIRILEG